MFGYKVTERGDTLHLYPWKATEDAGHGAG